MLNHHYQKILSPQISLLQAPELDIHSFLLYPGELYGNIGYCMKDLEINFKVLPYSLE